MNNLERLREEKDLLKKEIAKDIGIVESVYCEWENEKLSIPTKRIVQLANYHNVNIDYMLGLSNVRIDIYNPTEIDINLTSQRLREIRIFLDLTMREEATLLNTTSSAISNYENGKFLILSTFLIELCRISNYSMDWVLGRSNTKYIK